MKLTSFRPWGVIANLAVKGALGKCRRSFTFLCKTFLLLWEFLGSLLLELSSIELQKALVHIDHFVLRVLQKNSFSFQLAVLILSSNDGLGYCRRYFRLGNYWSVLLVPQLPNFLRELGSQRHSGCLGHNHRFFVWRGLEFWVLFLPF